MLGGWLSHHSLLADRRPRMCLLPVIQCPDCEGIKVVPSWVPRYCKNPLCVRIKDLTKSPEDEPCHPSCNSEHCGLVIQSRPCRGSCDDPIRYVSPSLSFFFYRDPTRRKQCV